MAADLIVLGSHGRKGIGRFLLGSVSEAVARSRNYSGNIALSPEPQSGCNRDEDVDGMNADENCFFYLPRICNHCTYPACLEARPRNTINKREEDGIVVIDQDRGQGYRYCINMQDGWPVCDFSANRDRRTEELQLERHA